MRKSSILRFRDVLFILLTTFVLLFLNTFVNENLITRNVKSVFEVEMFIRWIVGLVEVLSITFFVYKFVSVPSNRRLFTIGAVLTIIATVLFATIYFVDR